jgi:hypothetical protein
MTSDADDNQVSLDPYDGPVNNQAQQTFLIQHRRPCQRYIEALPTLERSLSSECQALATDVFHVSATLDDLRAISAKDLKPKVASERKS